MDDDDRNKLRTNLVKLPVFTGNHTEFQTWWFHFQAFTMVWKFTEAIEQTAEKDLPTTASAETNACEEMRCYCFCRFDNGFWLPKFDWDAHVSSGCRLGHRIGKYSGETVV